MPKKPVFDIIAIGESLRDVFYFLDNASVTCNLNREHCLLCINYAEKIPVTHVVKVHAAGNSANAAVSSVRLGLKTALVTWAGEDAEGEDIRAHIEREGVDGRYIVTDSKNRTSEATILSYQGEKTQLVHFQPRRYVLPKLDSTRCIYYSAMGKKFTTLDSALSRHLRQHPDIFFAFQPGTTHIRSGMISVGKLLRRSNVFILNKDEAHQLLGDGDLSIPRLLAMFHHQGADIVVITDGKNGADAFDGNALWHMPILPVPEVESTGAGDSFAAALVVALLHGHDLATALRWGAANAAGVIQQIGPQKGLLTKIEMEKMLKKFAKIKPTQR